MADSFDVDLSGFGPLSASLAAIEGRLPDEARAVVKRAATNIKKDARARVSTNPTWRKLAATITYGLDGSNRVQAVATVGYEDRGQGELAGIAEFGSARHAPHPALMPAARDEAPRFEKAMADAIEKALKL